MFAQGFGPALFISFSQTIFSATLKHDIRRFAPDVDVQAVYKAGASAFRDVVDVRSLPGVVRAYNEAGNHVFYLNTAAACLVCVTAWGMGWKSVKKVKGQAENGSEGATMEVKV